MLPLSSLARESRRLPLLLSLHSLQLSSLACNLRIPTVLLDLHSLQLTARPVRVNLCLRNARINSQGGYIEDNKISHCR